MRLISYRIPVIFFAAGLCWALSSDWIISFFISVENMQLRNWVRCINDTTFWIVTSVALYNQIRRQQNKLIMSEEQYRALFESNPQPMWIFNSKTLRFVEVNNAAQEKYGYSHQEFLKMTIKDLHPVYEANEAGQVAQRQHEGIRCVGRWQHVKKSGEVIDVAIRSHTLQFNNQTCKMVLATDITDIVNNEKKLKKAYQTEKALNDELKTKINVINTVQEETDKLTTILNKITNLVLLVSEKGTILWANQTFIDFTGYSFNEAVGKHSGELLFGPDTDMSQVARILDAARKKESCSVEIINYKKNGDPYWTQVTLSPVFNKEGNLKFFISVENIISEQKERERKISEQNKLLSKLAWSTSHEIRRPLCSILSLADLLRHNLSDSEREQCIAFLETSANELDAMVKATSNSLNELGLELQKTKAA